VNTRQGTWGELKVGMTVQDKTGTAWLLAERDPGGGFVAQREDHREVVLKPKNRNYPMTIVEPTTQQAIDLVREGLGGTPEAYQEADDKGKAGALHVGPFTTASSKQAKLRMEEGRAHLFLLHAVWAGDVKDYAGLLEAHKVSHGDHEDNASTGDGYVPHIHRE
jgi:hypothetical protein